MRKKIIALGLVLLLVCSLVTSSMAVYNTTIDNLAEGSVLAKSFIFTSNGAESFQHGVKIAPTETIKWQFTVKNYNDTETTETDLYYKLTFHVTAVDGKSAIEPLVVSVKETDGTTLGNVTGVGSFDVTGAFPVSQTGQEKTYIVEIHWPDGTHDIDYAGIGFGSAIKVDAVASQVPLSGGGNGGGGQPSQVAVKYETTAPWDNGQSGHYQYKYKITITNNLAETIEDWNISFSLPTDRIDSVFSNGTLASATPNGAYTVVNPAYNNPTTDTIPPGQSVSFEGNASGQGTEAIANVTVGGSNVQTISNIQPTCSFGTLS